MSAPVDAQLAEFTSWELGEIRDALERVAAEHPAAPAVGALRAACVKHLVWDHYYRDCWSDPRFTPRLAFLRAAILDGITGPDIEFPVAHAVPRLTALLGQLEAIEHPEDLPESEEFEF